MNSILEIKDLKISYDLKVILKDISFDISKNSVTAILGPSGSGKSSILKSINRLIDNFSNAKVEGEILYKNQNIIKIKDINTLRKNIAMLFQNPAPLPFSIARNLEIVKEEWGEDIEVEDALKEVGLFSEISGEITRKAMSLSGGQKQRLCLARALMSNPELLLLDEPCSSLDPISTKKIEDLMFKLKKTKTIIFVTHDIHQARRIADNIIFIWPHENGARIIENTTNQDFFSERSKPITKSYLAGDYPDFSTLNLD